MQESTFNPFTQDELLLGIKSNEPKVLKWLYQSQYPKIEKYVLTNNGDEDQAKDLFQEAFISVWNNIRSGKFIPENSTAVTGYIYQIAKNKWLDYLRSSRYKKTTSLKAEHEKEDENEESEKEELKNSLSLEFQKLGDNCREILKRFYYQKETMEAIARAFQWTEATARNNKYRCIQRLKEKLNSLKNQENGL
jgi:RNA polymerase sigma factor (sigma-70 family)